MSRHINVHPGELLLKDFLKPMGITPYRLAKEVKLPNQRIHDLVHARRGITAETDLRLCAFFGLTPGYWLKAQLAYELREAQHTIGKRVRQEVRTYAAA